MNYKKVLPEEVFHNRLVDPESVAEFLRGDISKPLEVTQVSCDFLNVFLHFIHERGYRQVTSIAKSMGLTRLNLSHAVIVLTGVSPHDWIRKYLHLSSCILLKQTKLKTSEISKRLGFPSPSAFLQFFMREEKMSAGDWRYYNK